MINWSKALQAAAWEPGVPEVKYVQVLHLVKIVFLQKYHARRRDSFINSPCFRSSWFASVLFPSVVHKRFGYNTTSTAKPFVLPVMEVHKIPVFEKILDA